MGEDIPAPSLQFLNLRLKAFAFSLWYTRTCHLVSPHFLACGLRLIFFDHVAWQLQNLKQHHFVPFRSPRPQTSNLQAEARWTSVPRLGACTLKKPQGTLLSFLSGFTREDQHMLFLSPQALNLARGLTPISCLCVPGAIINIRKGKQMETLSLHLWGVCIPRVCRTAEG